MSSRPLTYRRGARGHLSTATTRLPRDTLGSVVRDPHYSPSDPLSSALAQDLNWTPSSRQTLSAVEDRRTFWPTPVPTAWEPARKLSGAPARLASYPPRRAPQKTRLPTVYGPSWVIRFRDAPRVIVCIRRKQRKQVMHAYGYAGGRVARPRRNAYSAVSCR